MVEIQAYSYAIMTGILLPSITRVVSILQRSPWSRKRKASLLCVRVGIPSPMGGLLHLCCLILWCSAALSGRASSPQTEHLTGRLCNPPHQGEVI